MSKKLMIGLGVGIIVLLGIIIVVTKEEPLATDGAASSSHVPSLGPAAAQGTALPRLVDLGAGKCIPCKMMAPILEELKEEYAGRLKVEFIDVWENPDAGGEYGIKLIPTQIFYDASGKELFRHQGFFSKEDILAKWKELGINIDDPPTEAASR